MLQKRTASELLVEHAPSEVGRPEVPCGKFRSDHAPPVQSMKGTDRLVHSVRGHLSTAGKRRDLNIESTKNDADERLHHIKR